MVLVVEDQDDVCAQIADVLTAMGCEVVEATDGPRALQIIESRRPIDLLVTDVGLPGINGRQLADTARATIPWLPALMITGYAGRALDNAELAPGVEILRKPFALDDLAARVGVMLARRGSAS